MTSSPGVAAEDLVVRRLAAEGWLILGVRTRVGREEIDVVGIDPGPPATLVLVEVRWRRRRDFGLAEESLDHRKRLALRRGIAALLDAGEMPDGTALPRLAFRVDLVVVEPPGRAGEGPRVRHHRGIAL